MKLLKDILYRCRIQQAQGSTHVAIEHIASDSRRVKPFSLFIAVRGTVVDGHNFIDAAIASGAVAVVCEQLPEVKKPGITYVVVEHAAEALGYIAANFYDNPSEQIRIVAVTGTNGKTTTVTLLYNLFRLLNKPTGLLSTVVNRINDQKVTATHTTPDAIQLNALLREMVDKRIEYCFMEASSHALDQHRMTGIKLAGGVFTNITHDHLDYHGSFNNYIKAKKTLFDRLPASAFALVNNDDSHAEVMVQNCKARVRTYGLKTMCDYKAKMLENQFGGMQLLIDGKDLYTKLIGGFNASNLLAVYGIAMLLGMDQLDVLTNLSMLGSVDGRFQHLRSRTGISGIVDYAHTPDALKNVLGTIAEIRTGNEKVITVVGCGGDRDREKRPIMAQIAADRSDRVILTSDNPRSENPETILSEMRAGLDPVQAAKTFSIVDRREAIRMAISLAEKGDIVLVAGKGHEKYQEINGERIPFDDVLVISETFNTL
jgi:UDP-N-acetylmuramoyl-L-alanyl-D-glutamate--2,6-diaminopimelate ligase